MEMLCPGALEISVSVQCCVMLNLPTDGQTGRVVMSLPVVNWYCTVKAHVPLHPGLLIRLGLQQGERPKNVCHGAR